MSQEFFNPGETSRSVLVSLLSSTDGSVVTGLTYSGMTIITQVNGSGTNSPETVVNGSTTSFVSGGFIETTTAGLYRFGIPDARLTNTTSLTIQFSATGAFKSFVSMLPKPSVTSETINDKAGYNLAATQLASIAPAATALTATNLSNLDATISSRAPASTALAASNLANLDATISSRAPASTALAASNLTSIDANAAIAATNSAGTYPIVSHVTYGNAAILAALPATNGLALEATQTTIAANVLIAATNAAGAYPILSSGTYGNSALKTAISAIPTNAATIDAASLRAAIGMTNGATFDTDILAIENNIAGLDIGAGKGAYDVTVHVTDGASDLENVMVRMTQGTDAPYGSTDSKGLIKLYCAYSGAYAVVGTLSGYQQTASASVNITGSGMTVDLALVKFVPDAPPSDLEQTAYIYCYDGDGNPAASVTVEFRLLSTTQATGVFPKRKTATSDVNGLIQTALLKSSQWQMRWGTGQRDVTTTTDDRIQLPALVGG